MDRRGSLTETSLWVIETSSESDPGKGRRYRREGLSMKIFLVNVL